MEQVLAVSVGGVEAVGVGDPLQQPQQHVVLPRRQRTLQQTDE